jgi:aryl-alcohol dehydrogenase-like predicted oxidoreductase
LNRFFENASAEVCLRENVAYCVFTNGFWYFIWKILTGESHPKARLTLFRNTLDTTEQSTQATRLYHEIAIKNGLTLTELSLAFIEQQPVTSTIIGRQQ